MIGVSTWITSIIIRYSMATLRAQEIGPIAPFAKRSKKDYILRSGEWKNPAIFREWTWNREGGSASLDPPYDYDYYFHLMLASYA